MKVVILHQTIAKHEAIGNDISYMYAIISRKHEVFEKVDLYYLNPVEGENGWNFSMKEG